MTSYSFLTTNLKRGDCLVFDREHLAYLNALEILNCAYRSYADAYRQRVEDINAGPKK